MPGAPGGPQQTPPSSQQQQQFNPYSQNVAPGWSAQARGSGNAGSSGSGGSGGSGGAVAIPASRSQSQLYRGQDNTGPTAMITGSPPVVAHS